MPIKFDDVAQHIDGIPNRQASMHALLDSIESGVRAIGSSADLQAFLANFREHRDALVAAVEGGLPGTHRNLGPGETPFMPGDKPVSAQDAEQMGNPAVARDMSGHKMHPADALSQTGGTKAASPNLAQAEDFGGNGNARGGLEGGGHVTSHVEPITGDTIKTTVGDDGKVIDVERIPRVGAENGQIDKTNGPVA